MKIHVLFIISLIVIFNSCNKKMLPPKDEQSGPVFYFKCDVAGFPVNLEAGVNSYYMKSSYYKDSNSVYIFKAELKQKECSGNCGFGLTVLINDYKVSTNSTMTIDSTLQPNSYQYNDASIAPLYYTVNFTPTQATQVIDHKWTFSDGVTSDSNSCIRILKANTNYTSTLLSTSNLFGSISHSNVYRVGNALQTNVNAVRINPNSIFNYKFSTANYTGKPPFTYVWDFGDGYTSTLSTPSHEYLVGGLYRSKLTIVDANNDTCESYYQIPAFNGSFGESNFNAYFTPIQNTKALSAISIIVNDPQGLTYSSNHLNQSEENHFEIVSIENYTATDTNQPLKKIKIKFNCTVYNGANTLEIKNGEAVIAVAYKN